MSWVTARLVLRLLRGPQATGSAPESYDQELLDRHRPLIVLDCQYDYAPLAAESAVENQGNLLRSATGEVLAGGSDAPELDLSVLSSLDKPESGAESYISMVPDYAGAGRHWERRDDRPPRIYGRVVKDGGRIWLQYWFWFYYNPKHLFGFGRHEGDWEMIQLGLGSDETPEVATYAQHDSGEARNFRAPDINMEKGENGQWRPKVYVAPYSHASYFKAGRAHPYFIGIDQAIHPADDELSKRDVPVTAFGDWARWPGRWGNSEYVIARRIGNGPPSPSRQGPKWDRPATWHKRVGRRWPLVLLERAMHWVGDFTFPPRPTLNAWMDGDQAIVKYRMSGKGLRRARHLYITVSDGPYVLADRTVRQASSAGEERIRLPEQLSDVTVRASAFNRFHQRSNPEKIVTSSN